MALEIKINFDKSKITIPEAPINYEDLITFANRYANEAEVKYFYYIDEDNDKITVSSQYDYNQAKLNSKYTLNLFVEKREKDDWQLLDIDKYEDSIIIDQNLIDINEINEEPIKQVTDKETDYKILDLVKDKLNGYGLFIQNVTDEAIKKVQEAHIDDKIVEAFENVKTEVKNLVKPIKESKGKKLSKQINKESKKQSKINKLEKPNKEIQIKDTKEKENKTKEIKVKEDKPKLNELDRLKLKNAINIKNHVKKELKLLYKKITKRAIIESNQLIEEKYNMKIIEKEKLLNSIKPDLNLDIETICCSSCSVKIDNIIYQCSSCKEMNICENCEELIIHKHPFIKIRKSNLIQKKPELIEEKEILSEQKKVEAEEQLILNDAFINQAKEIKLAFNLPSISVEDIASALLKAKGDLDLALETLFDK